jgi:phosphoglycerate dehydrogenase-like enzyme
LLGNIGAPMTNNTSLDTRTGAVVGIYHADPESVVPRIEQIVPEDRLRICERWDDLGSIIREVDVLLAFKFGTHPFPKELILTATRLRWIQLASAGVDHMVPHARSDLVVTNASGIHGPTMAQFVIGSLVNLLWDFPRIRSQQQDRVWHKYEVDTLVGKTMAVIGAGHVGSSIGLAAKALGMRVVGVRRIGRPVEGFDESRGPESLSEVLREADVVVVTLPLTHWTRGLIGSDEIACMRPDAILVNVSRGGIVDEGALVGALRERRIARAVLDVFETEPLPASSEFWALENVLVTPHISSEGKGWDLAVADLFCDNLGRWQACLPLCNVVDPIAGY